MAVPSSRPAMLMPPDSPHRAGCARRFAVYESALDHTHPIHPRRRTVGLFTDDAVQPRCRSIRWSNITFETFLAQAGEADSMGDGVPSWVERDFRAYLRCGILAHGFARARCSGCGYGFLVALTPAGQAVETGSPVTIVFKEGWI